MGLPRTDDGEGASDEALAGGVAHANPDIQWYDPKKGRVTSDEARAKGWKLNAVGQQQVDAVGEFVNYDPYAGSYSLGR